MGESGLELLLVAWFVCTGLGASIAEIKGRPPLFGLMLTLFCGPLGIAILASLPALRQEVTGEPFYPRR